MDDSKVAVVGVHVLMVDGVSVSSTACDNEERVDIGGNVGTDPWDGVGCFCGLPADEERRL